MLGLGAWRVGGVVTWSSGALAVPAPKTEGLLALAGPPPPPDSEAARILSEAPLTVVSRSLWNGPWEVWMTAMADRVLDPRNPLDLSPEEHRRSLELFRLMIHRKEQYTYRVGQLRELLASSWVPTDQISDRGQYLSEEDLLLRLPPLTDRLRGRAEHSWWERLEPDPFGEDIVMQCARELAEGMSEEQELSEGVEGESERFGPGPSPTQVVNHLERVVDAVGPGEAARAVLLLEEIEQCCLAVRDCWAELSVLALAGDRLETVREAARGVNAERVSDEGRVYDSILKASARQLLKDRSYR